MKKAHSFVLPIILYVFPLMDIFACSCFSEEKTMSEVVVSQVAVFSGVILSNESIEGKWGDAYYKSKVRLTKVWKLEGNEKVVTIRTATEISSCGGPPPKVGEEYIVFSHAVVNGIHSTGGCSYFSSIENKNETVLEFIQELGPPKRMYEK